MTDSTSASETEIFDAICLECTREDKYKRHPELPEVEVGEKRGQWCPGCMEKTEHHITAVENHV